MSFQGDVAGIGLGELLQGLSRGGRDGVLTLYGDKISQSIGLHGGQLYFLAGPDEDDEIWRERSLCAYAEVPDSGLESQRRERIARADRLETMYRMLEAPNLHFRFEPGPLPGGGGSDSASLPSSISLGEFGGGGAGGAAPASPAWGPGLTVEYMLLEHARISDEANDGAAADLSWYDMPRTLDAGGQEQSGPVRDFLEECDGNSTLQEIADRSGWPLTQCRNTVGDHIEAGHLRIAQPRELLASAQRELELGRIGRAATRISGWVLADTPGPPTAGDANLLVGEWENGRLSHILHKLAPRVGRTLLRKLDKVHDDRHAARDRWRTLYDAHKSDEIAMLHEVALRLVATENPEARTFHDLLRLARTFQDRELPARTRTLLRLAAGHLPERPKTRVELGKRMLETGLIEEGTRWLLNTAHEYIDAGDPERALGPIRAVLRVSPENGEAGSLQIHARVLLANQKKRKIHLGVAASIAVIVSLAAFVRYRSYREVEHWIGEIQAFNGPPAQAIARLDDVFGHNPPARIADLRDRLVATKRLEDEHAFELWNTSVAEAARACEAGDPVDGLERALALLPPPDHGSDSSSASAKGPHASIPERQDLLGVLAARLQARSEELDVLPTAHLDALNEEQQFLDLLDELIASVDLERAPPEIATFHFRTSELRAEIAERRALRAKKREVLTAEEQERQDDVLLATARAHVASGDLERALAAFDRLLKSDESLRGLTVLTDEIEAVRQHWRAVSSATELAEAGDHEAAARELARGCPKPSEHLLPYNVDSRPSGARVVTPDGRVRTTPFVAKSGVGEEVELRFSSPGFGDRVVTFDHPAHLLVMMFKGAERHWESENRIEAVPVPTGDDHILADRRGRILRLDAQSRPRWEQKLTTLGGIARTPVFLPGRPGHLLVISEDGKTWLVNSADGEITGPRDIGSPPVEGPVLTRGGATISFADGRVGVWDDRLEPTFYQNESLIPSNGSEEEELGSTLAVLRRSIDRGTTLVSPWNDWKIRVRDHDYRVLAPDGLGFTIERFGDWSYVAWEAPKAGVRHGRVWVSDEAGVRSYVPALDELVRYDD